METITCGKCGNQNKGSKGEILCGIICYKEFIRRLQDKYGRISETKESFLDREIYLCDNCQKEFFKWLNKEFWNHD